MMFYAASAALLLGVVLASLVPVSLPSSVFVLFIAACCALVSCFRKNGVRFAMVALLLCATVLGMWRVGTLPPLQGGALNARVDEKVTLQGMVVDDADVREHGVLFTLQVIEDGKTYRILVRAPAYTEGTYGDTLKAIGTLALPESFDTDTGRTFDYPGYLSVSGIGYILNNAQVSTLSHGGGNPIIAVLFTIKHIYLRGLSVALSFPQEALAGGITAGDKRSLGTNLLNDFRTAGIVHIVVLSGYNVTIIAETLLKMLAFLPLRASLFVGSLGIAGFALATGAGASIVRASIMAILALIARALNRSYSIVRALALAVVGMVLWNPQVLLHDPGFQLSVLATIGLVFVSPLVEERFSWVPKKWGMREVVGATLGTQITVLPLLLYQTGSLSLVALPVNILVLAVIPAAMLLSFIAAIAGVLMPAIALIVGMPANVLLSYVLGVVALSVRVPFAALNVPAFPAWPILCAYAALFGFLWWVYKKKSTGS